MKSKWQFKLTKHSMNHQLLTEWEKHSWLNRRRQKCRLISLNWKQLVRNLRTK